METLEIEVFNIIFNPGNIGNRFFQFSGILEILEIGFSNFPISWKYWILDSSIFSYPGNTGNLDVFYFLPSWKYWKLKSSTFSIILEMRAVGGRLQGLGSGGLGLFLEHVPGKTSMATLELRSTQFLF